MQYPSAAGKYGVQGLPTIKFMYHDGSQIKAVDYKSGRTAEDIINFAMDKAKALALKRIGKKASSSGGSTGGGSKNTGVRLWNITRQMRINLSQPAAPCAMVPLSNCACNPEYGTSSDVVTHTA